MHIRIIIFSKENPYIDNVLINKRKFLKRYIYYQIFNMLLIQKLNLK